MRTSLRRIIVAVTFSLLFPAITASAAPPDATERQLAQKALLLTLEACNIYPAIVDLDKCVDKVVRSILASRGVVLGHQNEIIALQKANAAVNHPAMPGDDVIPPEQLHVRGLMFRVFDIIDTSCAIDPVINDFDACMDKAYHSILASRDPHSTYMSKDEADEFFRNMRGDLQGIGAEVALTEDKVVGIVRVMPGSPAEQAGILDGDRIVAIVNGAERSLTSSFSTISEAIKKIRGRPNTKVTLEILRGEKDTPVTITVVRAAIRMDMIKTEILTAPNDPKTKYAYVKLVQFGDALRTKMISAVKDILKKNKDVKGIIFDVRGNPGGSLGEVYEAVDALADSPDALVSIRDNDGVHAYGTSPDERKPSPQPGDITNGLPMAVLIDGGSASASEIFAGALKELDRAVIIGKGTWRKGSVQILDSLGDGSFFKTTRAEYLIGSPTKWVAVQCVGVEPDIAYEAEAIWKPKKEIHECDLPGAIVSGGARSIGNLDKGPLFKRNPARYRLGKQMLEAVKAFDRNAFMKNEQIRKKLKLPVPKDEPEGK